MVKLNIVYEKAPYFITKVKAGFEVWKNGVTHSTRCAQVGWTGDFGLHRTIAELERRIEVDAKKH